MPHKQYYFNKGAEPDDKPTYNSIKGIDILILKHFGNPPF